MGKWLAAAQDVPARIDAWQALIEHLQKRLHMPIWAELDLGTSIRAGDTVRYVLREYECILSHTKALTRYPGNTEYWKLIEP